MTPRGFMAFSMPVPQGLAPDEIAGGDGAMSTRASALGLMVSSALAAGTLAITGCGVSPASCAGQCSAPFELKVIFKAATPASAAQAVLAGCGHDPVVIRIGQLSGRRHRTAIIYTHVGFRQPRTAALLKCLHSAPSVVTAAWPD
jgi:hypothetical protein